MLIYMRNEAKSDIWISCNVFEDKGGARVQRFRLNQRKWDSVKLLLMILPFLVLVFLFSYLPLAGWLYAFYDYRPGFSLE